MGGDADDMRIRTRLLLFPIITLIFLLVTLAVISVGLAGQKSALDNLYANRLKGYATCSTIYQDILSYHFGLYKVISWSAGGHDAGDIKKLVFSQEAILGRVVEAITEAAMSQGLDVKEKSLYSTAKAQVEEYRQSSNQVLDVAGMNVARADALMDTAEDKMSAFEGSLASLQSEESVLAEAAYQSAARSADFTRILILLIIALSMAASLTVSLLVSRQIMRPLHALGRRAKDISKGTGDLTQKLTVESRDELGELGASFNEFISKIDGSITHVKAVSGSSREIGSMLSRIALDTSSDTIEISETVNSAKRVSRN